MYSYVMGAEQMTSPPTPPASRTSRTSRTSPTSPTATDMVGKALSLLTRLGDHPHGVLASELARMSGFPLSTAHRLLGALVRDGYARFDPETKRYTLGLRVFQLAQRVSQARGFTGLTRRILEEVSLVTREATMFAVLDGDRQLYVHSIEGPQQVRVVGEPGKHGPLHCTSQGKVLIAFSPADVRSRLVETLRLEKCGPNTITDRGRFRDEIDLVRARGYAIADEENEVGIRAIGVPVLDGDYAIASVATAAPAYRMTVPELIQHLPTLTEAAKTLSAVMAFDRTS
jgi:IclR family transcriptional regulator, acetate operon repressor